MKKVVFILFLLFYFDSFAQDCSESLEKKNLLKFESIILGVITKTDSSYCIKVLKSWKGNIEPDSNLKLDYKAFPLLDFIPDQGVYILFLIYQQNQLCNVASPYYYFDKINFLDLSLKTTIKLTIAYKTKLDSIEYDRMFIVHCNEDLDIKNMKVVFVVSDRFLNWWTKYKVISFMDIERMHGFYSTRFYLVERNYQTDKCIYDYVFWVTNSHSPYIITKEIEKKVKKKVNKFCT